MSSKPAANGSTKKESKPKQPPAASKPEAVVAATKEKSEDSKKEKKVGGGGGNEQQQQIKRNIKPEPSVRDAEIEVITNEMGKLKREREEVAKKMRELKEKGKEGNEERQKLRAEQQKIKEELQKARAEKDLVVAEQKACSSTLEQKYAEERRAKDGLGKFSTVEAIENEINRMESVRLSSNLSAKEEKDIIREMEKLRLSKKNVGALKSKLDDISKVKESKKLIDNRLAEKKSIVDETQARYQVVHDSLISLDNKEKDGIGAKLQELRKKHDSINEKLDELVKKKQKVYDDFQVKFKEFIEAEKERKKLEAERRAAEVEKRKSEQEEIQRQNEEKKRLLEEEEAKIKPWQEEIALCDLLIGYLTRLSGSNNNNNNSSSSTGQAPLKPGKKSSTDFGDLKPLQREKDDQDFIKVGDASGKSKKVAKASAIPVGSTSTVLVHDLDILTKFTSLSLVPPSTKAGLEVSITQVQEKRAYYDVLPRPPKKSTSTTTTSTPTPPPPPASSSIPTEEDAATNGDHSKESPSKGGETKKKATASTGNKSKKSTPPIVQDSETFPNLPGSKPSSSESKKWGPKTTNENASEEDLAGSAAVSEE